MNLKLRLKQKEFNWYCGGGGGDNVSNCDNNVDRDNGSNKLV